MASNLERTRIGKSMGRGIGDVGAANLERTGQGRNALEAKKKTEGDGHQDTNPEHTQIGMSMGRGIGG